MSITVRPRPDLAERNLRILASNGIRAGLHQVCAYTQDIVDVLAELERARAAASAAVEDDDLASPLRLSAAAAGRIRG